MSFEGQAFQIFTRLALSAPFQNLEACLSVACEGDAEVGDLCEWTNDTDKLRDGFESQGDGVLLVRSTDSDGEQKILGEFVFIDQGGEIDELLVDYSVNDYSERVVQVWTEKVT